MFRIHYNRPSREVLTTYRADVPATYLYPKVDLTVTTDRLQGYSAEMGDLVQSLHRLSVAGQGRQ